jgi:virulence-associated protein VagC
MKTIDIVETGNGQSVPLPEEFRFATPTVSIRRQGDAVILEPVKSGCWPDHFFENIRIDDPTFRRPVQGVTPPAPSLD